MKGIPRRKPREERAPWKYFQDKKVVLRVYIILRFLVLATLVWQLFEHNYENAFICVLTLILFILPSIIERRLHIDLPDTLEIIILLFIFAADILGEIQEYYVLVPHWDTVLHTINGFLFAAIGFSIVNIFNEDKRISMTLSPFYMAVAAFCFSMTIGILWEFFEWGADLLMGFDMQKDTIVHSLSSVTLHPQGRNDPYTIHGIRDVIVVLSDGTQVSLGLGGYLDIGLQDTMKDLLVNLIGAAVFSVIGYFYVKTKGKGRFARMFIPEVVDAPSQIESGEKG
ncbi:MAG: hypothetical protein J6Q53_05295 [Oscillospiraceae bacterium]|nr:hypothetical protein [Oscillospiraceae bacterium]